MSVSRSVSVVLSASVSGYIAEMRRAGAATETAMGRAAKATTIHNKALGASKALAKGAGIATLGAGVAVAGGLALAVKEAANFAEKMALVQSLSHANASQMRQLSNEALHAGTQFGYTATQVADGQAEMIKAGVSLKDIMGGGLTGVLSLAAAGQTDVGTATSIAASALTQFNLQGKDVPHVADLLAAGADKALGSVEDLGYGLDQVGTTAHQMGFSINDTVGTLAEFAQAGLTGERGGTTLKQMFLQLAAPTKQAKTLMDQYGLSLYDANGKMKTLPQLAGNIQSSFKDLSPAARNAALGIIFGSRAIQGANILLKDGEKGNRKWIASVNDQGFAAQQARGKLNSLKGDFSKLKAVAETALIGLGTGAQGPLRSFVQDATSEIDKLTRNHSLERWGKNIGDGIRSTLGIVKSLAPGVGQALKIAGSGIKLIADGVNSLPGGVQKALITGAVVAAGAKKLGLTSLIGTAAKVAGVGGGLPGRGVTPVFVTNMGAGGLGGIPGKGGGVVKQGESLAKKGAGFGALLAPEIIIPAAALVGIGVAFAKSIHATDAAGQSNDIAFRHPGASNTAVNNSPIVGTKAMLDGSLGRLGKIAQEAAPATKNWDEAVASLDSHFAKLKRTDPAGALTAIQGLSKRTGLSMEQLNVILPKTATAFGSLSKATKTLQTGGFSRKISGALNLEQLQFQANKAGISTQKLGRMLGSLPQAVQTKIITPGAIKSKADVTALAKQFGLTPRQVQTIMRLVGAEKTKKDSDLVLNKLNGLNKRKAMPQVDLQDHASMPIAGVGRNLLNLSKRKALPTAGLRDQASGPIRKVQAGLNRVGSSRPKPTITARDLASGVVRAAEGVLASFNGRRASATITTTYITRGHPSAAAAARNPSLNKPAGQAGADGAYFSGRTRAFADGGGYTDQGAYVPRVPQLRQGGGNVLWSEPETGWEAYISGKPGMRDRNLSILSMAADRLGAQVVANANGNITTYASGGTSGLQKQTQTAEKHHVDTIKSVTKELGKLKSKLQSIPSARREYASGVSQAFVSDPFGGTLGGFDSQIRYENKKLGRARADLLALKKRGLNGALYKDLAASGNASLIDSFANLTPHQIRQRERAYSRRNAQDRQVGNIAAATAFPSTAPLQKQIAGLTRELRALRHGHHIGNTNIHTAVIKDSGTKAKATAAARRARHG